MIIHMNIHTHIRRYRNSKGWQEKDEGGIAFFFFGQGGRGVYHIELVKFMTAKYHSWNNTSLDAWSITLFKKFQKIMLWSTKRW